MELSPASAAESPQRVFCVVVKIDNRVKMLYT